MVDVGMGIPGVPGKGSLPKYFQGNRVGLLDFGYCSFARHGYGI